MSKIRFTDHVLPHIIAIAVFLVVTVFFFKPVFFESKIINQHDIQEHAGTAKTIADYREKTGEEALWADAIFSGMPAYFVSVVWGSKALAYLKVVCALGLPHPVCNIYLAFLCYYIMLLAFGVRPWLAIAAAIAFGLSSYVIIGLGAGHNSRIGAIAFMPLVIAGIHLAFTDRRVLGFAVTCTGMALHLNENHLQITYYLLILVALYGVFMLLKAINEKGVKSFLQTVAVLAGAVVIAAGSFFGQFWATAEYSAYSIRGKNELASSASSQNNMHTDGLGKDRAFEYSDAILEPLTLLIPDFYGGSSMNFLVRDQKSATYQALVRSGNEQMANQLASYTSSYWGPQPFTAPYYAGAIIVFLFAIGICFAPRQYTSWLVSATVLGIMLSWGSSFASFNYFLFDYLPGYNKFRSVTFALVLPLFAMPLLGMIGLEKLLSIGITKETRKKVLIALASTGGLCLLFLLFAGMFSFTRDAESQLPAWFLNALAEDRKSLFRADAFRSLAFILAAFIVIYFDVHKKISATGFYVFLIFIVVVDLTVVDKRYLSGENFVRKRDTGLLTMNAADQEILKDKSYYRVYNLPDWTEARTSYYHYSIGGYHGAKLRRYQDFYDSCIAKQTRQFVEQAQQGDMDLKKFGAFNMLNVKYIVYGPDRNNVIPNPSAFGNAWFVQNIIEAKSPAEELEKTCSTDTRNSAVIDVSEFKRPETSNDSTSSINLLEHTPRYLKYESKSQANSLAVFSEIYYPKGWVARIDGKETPILRADYLLRGLEVPAGNHTIEFSFDPKPYVIGNKVTMASSWLVLLILLGSIGWTLRKEKVQEPCSTALLFPACYCFQSFQQWRV
jgi:hypothetical protein